MAIRARAPLGCFLILSFVSGCTATSTTPGSSPVQPSNIAQDIVNRTRTGCQFVPTITSILAIVNVPGAPAADKIVQAICKEVNKTTEAGFVEPGKQFTVTLPGGKTVVGALDK